MYSKIKKCLGKFLYSNTFSAVHGYIQIITMFSWLILLHFTSACYVIYLLTGLCGCYCRSICNQDKKEIFKKSERFNLIAASVFSLFMIAANYDIYRAMLKPIVASIIQPSTVQSFQNHSSLVVFLLFLFCFPFLFLGGMYVAYFILKFVTKKASLFSLPCASHEAGANRVFLKTFGLLTLVHASILLLCFYPGTLSGDSIVQIRQTLSNHYNNLHPVYHTLLIKLFMMIGIDLFHDINIGVALYSVFSVMFTSSVFAYGVVTLYQMNISKKILIAVTTVYLIFPQHIFYSFTMWKDVIFSTFVLLFTVSMFRYIEKTGGGNRLNYSMVLFSSLGMCLFRGNGFIVLLMTIIAFSLLFGKTMRKTCVSLGVILLSTYIVTFPVLSSFNLEQADLVELTSVPIQQVARTLKYDNDLTDEQIELISHVADTENLANKYYPYLSNNLKFHIRDYGNQEYIKEHKLAFLSLYLELGITHPKSFSIAWIDQTKGFWNAGYDHRRFIFYCEENELGIRQTVASKGMNEAVHAWAKLFEYFELFKPFVSIGFHTWLILLIAFLGYRKKDKLTVLLTIPCLAIVFSLMIGTPSFAEFRYAYALFCCLPFLAVTAFRSHSSKENLKNLQNTCI